VNVKKEIERLEKSNVKLTMTVGKDDVLAEYNDMLNEYTKTIQIPGFRKGKVPREVLLRKFGDALKQEAMGRIVEKSVETVFSDESMPRDERPLPYSRPEIQDEPKLDLESDLKFAVIYDVLPKITIEKWEGIEVEVPDVIISDDDISRELEQIREQNAIVLDREENDTAEKDNVVTVNYCELTEAGETAPGTERQDFVFTLKTGTEESTNFYRFDDEITGMKKDETRDFTKTYPEDFTDKELAGQTKKLRVTLTALKSKKLPDLDDDLAQDVDEKYKTLDDLKNNIREKLSNTLKMRMDDVRHNKILEKMMEAAPVILPDSMVNMELDGRWRNLARRFNTDNEGLHKMMGQQGGSSQEILEKWKPDAARALHSRLIVETLMENLKLEATDEEYEKEVDTIAGAGENAGQIRDYYRTDQMKELLKDQIRERKLFAILSEKNTIKTGDKMKYLEFLSVNG